MSEVHVRESAPEDFDEIMRLSLAAAGENALSPPDLNLVADEVRTGIAREGGVIGVIGSPAGTRLEGMIILRLSSMWYNLDPIIQDNAIFVDPDFRSAKGGRARKLAEWAKFTSEKLGIPLAIGVMSNTRTEAKIRLFERVFGPPAGVYFLHNAKTGLSDVKEG
jgi:hypothetical protein